MEHSVNKELDGWSHSNSCGQWLDVQVESVTTTKIARCSLQKTS